MTGSGIVPPLPCRAGIGLRAPHYREILARLPSIGWMEVHSENYLGAGGQPLRYLEAIRAHYPISLHGVGMSLGSADGIDRLHLQRLKQLIRRVEPAVVSEHLCWGAIGGLHLNDLLPLPCTEEALAVVCAHVEEVQDFLGRQILVENVSSYLQFSDSCMAEWDFVAGVAERTGCGLVLDVNNIYVSAINHGFDPLRYLRAIPPSAVQEIHLAGFDQGEFCLIDTHGKPVSDEVWVLYRHALARFGAVPTLIEWDTDLPQLDVLLGEAATADRYLDTSRARAA
ncbi:MAG: DUF692 domain-containing protein [Candidatus Methylophosphatis roskildensis]